MNTTAALMAAWAVGTGEGVRGLYPGKDLQGKKWF